MAQFKRPTTTDLITNGKYDNAATNTIIETLGYTTKGDGGAAQWRKTGNTVTASQTPAQLASANCSDANGNEFELVGNAINIKTLGAVGDGVADDTLVFVAAANAEYGEIYAPSGHYLLGTSTVVDLKRNYLKGDGVYDRTDFSVGTFFYITDTTNEAFSVPSGGSISGCNFYYPNQVTTATATVYPPTIRFATTASVAAIHTVIEDNIFVNSYIAINTTGTGEQSNYFRIQNNDICAISVGVIHDFSLTECYIQNNNFSYQHWNASIGQDIRDTISSAGFSITLGDVAGTYISGNTYFGISGIKVLTGEGPSITKVLGNTFDGSVKGIAIEDDVDLGEFLVTGNHYLAKDPNDATNVNCRCIEFLSTTNSCTGFLTITGNSFGPSNGDHIYIDTGATASFLRATISGNSFITAGSNDTVGTHFSVYVNSPTTSQIIVSGNMIEDSINQASGKVTGVYLDVTDGTIQGNTFRYMDEAIDLSSMANTGQVAVTGNVSRLSNTADILYPSTQGIVTLADNRLGDIGSASYSIASAATVTLPDTDTQFVTITGTTGITSVAASWPDRVVTLKFNGALTVTDGSNLNLAGNFSTTGQDTLTIACDGTDWYELSRSVN